MSRAEQSNDNPITCVECGATGDLRSMFDFPNEPGNGLCKDRQQCQGKNRSRNR